MSRFIFITGGVTSSLGKGIAAASLGALLQARGFTVRLRKLDPYLNVDPGTLSPYQHGEVFVTEDGTETDLDLGHYERFTGVRGRSTDYLTTGQLYSTVLASERRGDYLGSTVQVIPHITEAIHRFLLHDTAGVDMVISEIGGTVGDIECAPYLEALRTFRRRFPDRVLFLHVTLIPYLAAAGELKTKPTQHSVKTLLSAGIQPDMLLCRCDRPLPAKERQKIALFGNIASEDVIAGQDASSIYDVPLQYHREGLDTRVCYYFGLDRPIDYSAWWACPSPLPLPLVAKAGTAATVAIKENMSKPVHIAIVGKYTQLPDAYQSLLQALYHGGMAHARKVEIHLVDSEHPERDSLLDTADGVVIPGGFGERGVQGMLSTLTYTRNKKIPTLGICFGMQLMVIEACRELLSLPTASSTEFGPTDEPVVDVLAACQGVGLGGTMRLGAYPCHLQEGSALHHIYGTTRISERHRHRYEVNRVYQSRLEAAGLSFTGLSPDGLLPEAVEYAPHPWYIGVQYHPEFASTPFSPHPLFVSFVGAAASVAASAAASVAVAVAAAES
jgi:CTP synthase